MKYLIIGNIDFSEYVQEKTYSVINKDTFTEWIDANERVHRDSVRKKIDGSFDLGFASLNNNSFKLFCNALRNATTPDGVSRVQIWTQNEQSLKSAEVFVDISKIKESALPNGYVVTTCSVKVVQP